MTPAGKMSTSSSGKRVCLARAGGYAAEEEESDEEELGWWRCVDEPRLHGVCARERR